MWWRPVRTNSPVEPIPPLYAPFPFIEEEPVASSRRRRKNAAQPAQPFRSEPPVPAAVRQAFLNEEEAPLFVTYTAAGSRNDLQPPPGLLLDRKA
ncbi:hypothetical protein [Cohnella thermotolerans]|uniref:hypothetical protein n=1 Tax=Cohnella thermotolerans TaxID=329858 RepID=UPI0004139A99|nr:hypothetical protein [Cohnella thermotolerans]